jgi:uncharacterized delta-60 repeat protein
MRMRGRLIGALAAIFVLTWTGSAVAAAGDLDPSFGNGGKVVIPDGNNSGAAQIDLQADGKVVAITTIRVGAANDFALFRTSAKGDLDPTFGAGGVALQNVGGTDTASGLLIAPDQKIYATGTATFSGPSRLNYSLARFTSQGQLDSSFAGGSGFFTTRYEPLGAGDLDLAFAITRAPDGKVLVAGESNALNAGRRDFAVARASADGTLDSGFGGDGGTTVKIGGGTGDDAEANDVAVQGDGKVVLGGSRFGNGVDVVRLSAGGSPDGSFANGAGQVSLPGMSQGGFLAIQPDGKLIVAGSDGVDAVVERLNPNGDPDSNFSGDGRATVDFGSTDFANDVALQPDGKIVIAGSAVSGDDGDIGVARLQPNGSPDTTFGNGGIARVSVTPGDTGNTLALQPDGKIVVGGTSGSRVTPPFDGVLSLVRLQGDPGGSAKGKCAGKKATVVGTNGKDKLKGTKKKDVISAGRGKDTVKGLGGNDLICGGKGKDKLVGGPGKDKLLGQQGNDKLLGGPGKDTLKGGPGKKDKVNGGPGKDTEKP